MRSTESIIRKAPAWYDGDRRSISDAHSVTLPRTRCKDGIVNSVKKTLAPSLFSSGQGVNAAISFGLVLLLAATSWVPHLPSSLWLDETLTFWVVKDGLAETLERSVTYQSQPAYYVIMWFWSQVFGTSEVSLRIPSLLAALGACVALAKVGTSLSGDRETGLLGMIVFASTWNVFRESVDARSYMLGLAVLLCVVLCLSRWLERGRWLDTVWVGSLAASLPHLHIFFVLTFPALFLYTALRWSTTRANVRQIGLIAAFLLFGALLFIPAAATLGENSGSYSFVPRPQWSSLFAVFAWGPPVAGLLAGTCLAGLLGSRVIVRPDPTERSSIAPSAKPISREVALLLATWIFVPLLLLFFVSMFSEISIFLARYLIPAVPAVCLLYAVALRAIASPPARIVAVVVIALASFVTHDRPLDDFRGAARAVNEFVAGDSSVPVLLASGLIEGENEAWLRDPVRADYLISPTEYYPMHGRVLPLPRKLQGQPIANEIVEPILRKAGPFVAVEWYGNGARIMNGLIARAERAGYRVVKRGFGGVRVAFFRFVGAGHPGESVRHPTAK